jgi:hypothetical protein
MTTLRPANIDKYRGVSLSSTDYGHITKFKSLVGTRNGRRVTVDESTLDALKEANEMILKILGTDCAPDGVPLRHIQLCPGRLLDAAPDQPGFC